MGPADLDDVLEGIRLVVECIVQLLQRRNEGVADLLGGGNMHRGREGVVRGLRPVHMVIRMDRILRADHAAEHLDGAVGDHFIGVHIGLGARAGLPDRQGEMVIPLALGDLECRGGDRVRLAGGHVAEALIGECCRSLDDTQRPDERHRHGLDADRKVDQGAGGLRAKEFFGRDFKRSKAVGFGAHLAHQGRLLAAPWARVDDGDG